MFVRRPLGYGARRLHGRLVRRDRVVLLPPLVVVVELPPALGLGVLQTHGPQPGLHRLDTVLHLGRRHRLHPGPLRLGRSTVSSDLDDRPG